jgi:hypothetical protein
MCWWAGGRAQDDKPCVWAAQCGRFQKLAEIKLAELINRQKLV